MDNKPIVFANQPVRRIYDEKKEKWYFSVVDVISVLTSSNSPRKYWNKLAQRLREEGSEVVTKCHQLKFLSKDGKYYLSDSADTETLFRLIQSIPSPNAEPFKLGWRRWDMNGWKRLMTQGRRLTGHEAIGKEWEEARSGYNRE